MLTQRLLINATISQRAGNFLRQISASGLLTLLAIGISHASVATRFVPFNNFQSGGSPTYTVSGDFNMDGKLDLIASNSNGIISFLAGNGKGGFAAPVTITQPNSTAAQIAVGDFNFDGKPDILYLPLPGTRVYLLRGNGDGTFQAATSFPDGTHHASLSANDKMAAADVNGDGKPDVILYTTTGINVLLNNGSGVFGTAIHTNTTTFAKGVFFTTSDFNNDGRLDIALADYQGDLQVLRGHGDGTFTALAPVPGDPFNQTSFIQCVAADVDGNGNVDLILAQAGDNYPDGLGSGGFNIALGNGDGSFSSILGSSHTASYFVAGIAVADLDGNGTPDILTLNSNATSVGSKSIAVFPNNAGNFPAHTSFAVNRIPATLTIGDFNGDGRLDVASGESAGVSMLLNLGAAALRAPITADAEEYGTGGITTDLNKDGLADIVVLADAQQFHVPFGQVTAFLGNLNTKFGFTTILSGLQGPSLLAAANFNGDGFNDVCDVSGDQLEVVFYTSPGGFGNTSAPVTLPAYPNALAAGSFNPGQKGDFADIAFTDGLSLYVMLETGVATFAPATVYAVGSNPVAVVTRDMNGDGKTDLIVVNHDSDNVSILLGKGDGSFMPAVNYAAGTAPTVVTTGDFNRDNKIDLAVANGTNVAILLGNGDGTFQAYSNFPATLAGATSISQESFEVPGIEDIVVAGGLAFYILPGKGDGTFQAPVRLWGGSSFKSDVVTGDFNGDGAPDIALYSPQSMGTVVFYNHGGVHVGLKSSINPSHVGSSVTFTTTVTPSFRGTATPTGTVVFKDGSTVLASVALSATQASFTTSQLGLGTHSITAEYSGSATSRATKSPALSQSVVP